MNIIIIGCGKVGYTLVEQLNREDHNIVVVDTREDKLNAITGSLDAMGVLGNGVSYKVLREAGLARADLLIAVTGSDEQNLLACVIAKQAGHCKTIARVRNPLLNSEVSFLQEQLGIATIINPELTSAMEIARVFQFPSAVRIDSFVKGRLELMHFKINSECLLKDFQLIKLRTHFNSNVLVCMVTRGDEVIIPRGDFVFREGDMVAIAATPPNASDFFRKIGIGNSRVRNAMIVGGGTIAYYLARRLLTVGIDVKIIERDQDRCSQLCELLPKASIVCGDGTDQNLLLEEGLASSDGFAALTGMDEENILLSLYAKEVSKAKAVAKVNRINFSAVINKLNLDTITYPRLLTADVIVKYARSMHNSMNSNVENLYMLEDGKAEALEFYIKEDSEVTNVPLSELKIKKNILICSISRGDQIITPGGQDQLKIGDSVVLVLTNERLNDINDILER